jgi:adenine-specific DNA-methyltransferase
VEEVGMVIRNMESSREKVRRLLRELFQFDAQDLDFGIYHILNFRRKEIERFIEKDLIEAVETEFKEYAKAGMMELQREVERLRAVIIRDFGEGTIDEQGRAVKHEDAPKIKEYLRKVEELKSAEVSEAQMNEVFNHVYEFFSRYYDEGDFISKRRYGGREKYYIPYNGEEVVLYWANRDQYYVKTAEYFRNYHFKAGGYRVNFLLKEAEVEVNNVVGENKYFILCNSDFIKIDDEKRVADIYFEWRALTEEEEKKFGKRNVQDMLVADAINRIFSETNGSSLGSLLRVKGDGERTVLEKHLNNYVQRNTTDYFIHKNLKAFLERELEFYIKNEVVDLDELENLDERSLCIVRAKVKAIREISRKIIEFLAQIEDFQKMLFEKKKFIIGTEYVITLDKIKEYAGEEFLESIVGEILKNTRQLEEWKELLGMEIKDKKDLVERQTFEGKLWKKLPLDTRHFGIGFKNRLLEALSERNDLDEIFEGILIKSENFQAIRLLASCYRKKIDCVYLDPPYNSKSTEILYKNNYKHSSWLSLMRNRIEESKNLLSQLGAIIIAIDENEQERLGLLLEGEFPGYDKTCVAIVHNPRGIQGTNFSYCHDYAYFVFPKGTETIGMRTIPKSEWEYSNLRKWGGESTRETGANVFYPIYVKDGKIIKIGDVPPDNYHPSKRVIKKGDGVFEVWPIDQSGVERKWRYTRESLLKKLHAIEVKQDKDEIEILIAQTHEKFKTNWVDPRYDAGTYGTRLLTIMGLESKNLFPKSLYTVKDCLEAVVGDNEKAWILDFFAGSGTTAHALMELNREDKGKRKFILVEMADYFDTVMLPRIKKVAYSFDWKDGKPTESNGLGILCKYYYLEQYEDTLSNIIFLEKDRTIQEALDEFGDYLLKNMLEFETRSSPTRLNVEQFQTPFDYKIWVTTAGEKRLAAVDLVETFNYLLGITVQKFRTLKDQEREYRCVFGKLNQENTAIIWRNTKELDLKKDKEFIENTLLAGTKPDRIFINGDSLVEKAEPIEPVFKRLMGA